MDLGQYKVVQHSVIFLSSDLVFAARVRAYCQNADMGFYFGSSLPAETNDASNKDASNSNVSGELNPRYVILDLSTQSSLLPTLVEVGRTRFPEAKFIAYAPHVHKERLAKAQAAGYDEVMTRGQFDVWITRLSQ